MLLGEEDDLLQVKTSEELVIIFDDTFVDGVSMIV